jgi:hypothetical protein
MWFICSLRPAGSIPCLLPTPPRGDAVGTVCGAEPSNCTDGTFTRVDVRFTGAPTRRTDPLNSKKQSAFRKEGRRRDCFFDRKGCGD